MKQGDKKTTKVKHTYIVRLDIDADSKNTAEDIIYMLERLGDPSNRAVGVWFETDEHEPCWYKCSKCGRLSDIQEKFCPECGPRMANYNT